MAVAQYGYSRDEFLAMRITDIRSPEDMPRGIPPIAALAQGATESVRLPSGSWRHRLKDGQVRDVDMVSHVLDFAGQPAALVVAIDVTELKRTQGAAGS